MSCIRWISRKPLYGVGINDADYSVIRKGIVGDVYKIVWRCPYYDKWASMLKRCYSEKYIAKFPTYKDCIVCDEWLTFSNFKLWMQQQDWEGKELDKDILFPGNKVYSPHTCCFIDDAVNKFILDNETKRGEWPIGVCWDKQTGKFIAQIGKGKGGGVVKLGRFDTPEAAHKAWVIEKCSQAKNLALLQADERVAEALLKRYNEGLMYDD